MKSNEQTPRAVADCFALKVFGSEDDPNEVNDREFKDFFESISLSKQELAAFLAAPELSIPEVKRLFARRPNVRTK